MSNLIGADHLCPVCGVENHCRLATLTPGKGTCWCERAVVPEEVSRCLPEWRGQACLCERCLTGVSLPNHPVPGRDCYEEAGTVVFTAEFLRRRGHCCGSGCRHCPY